ncbi:hypothetical protein [Achromobacter anxifer]|uniref:hypothetical protein n=1 Tax=Achromobacter anxifer TaxID=1287737 RepID=UPI001581C5B4|nr:hypothetical protein [Achromobacter anxifer]
MTQKTAYMILGIGATCALLFVLIIGLATLFYWPPSGDILPTNSSELASWVQAIGSCAAIVGASLIASNQIKVGRQRDDQRLRERQNSIRTIVAVVLRESRSTLTALEALTTEGFTGLWRESQDNAFDAAIRAFDSTPIYELGSAARVTTAFSIREDAAAILNFAKASTMGTPEAAGAHHRAKRLLREYRERLALLEAELESQFPYAPTVNDRSCDRRAPKRN